jgi:alpha-beta hydrolase superfamily lysophospholipase
MLDKQILLWVLSILAVIYLLICGFFYVWQEKLIFYPTKLSRTYQFRFREAFQEQFIPTADGKNLHGLLFNVPAARGLVFFLHGNAGAMDSWGEIAATYTSLQYDVFMLDYRGFGKSEGEIVSEKQFYADVQAAYNHIKQHYDERNIIVVGFSIGSASAAMLAAKNNPGMLILQAPYYSLTDLMQHISPGIYAILPAFVFKYKFRTYQFVEETKAPVIIFHGDRDEVIYHGSSLKLKAHLKPTDMVITLPGQTHNGINDNRDYRLALQHRLLPGIENR